jgi:fumarate hydratase class II
MPGKANPTQAEVLLMICAQVIGNDTVINIAGSSGNFELNVFKPLIIYNFLQSINNLADAVNSFNVNMVSGIQPNKDRMEYYLSNSLMLVTALNPVIGYENAAKISKKALEENTSLKEAAIKLGLLSSEKFDEIIRPEKMVRPEE